MVIECMIPLHGTARLKARFPWWWKCSRCYDNNKLIRSNCCFLKTLSWKLETCIMLKSPSWASHSQLALTDVPLLWYCSTAQSVWFLLISLCKPNLPVGNPLGWYYVLCILEHEHQCPFAFPQISSKHSVFLERPSHMSAIHSLTRKCICLLLINMKVFSCGSVVVRVFDYLNLEF